MTSYSLKENLAKILVSFAFVFFCRRWLQRNFLLRELGRPLQGKDPVQSHKKKLSLMGTASKAKSISAALRWLRIGPSSKKDRSSQRRSHGQTLLGAGLMDPIWHRCHQLFLGHPLVLEEGQRCEYTERRSQFLGFNEEAIVQLLCSPGPNFAWIVAGRRVRIMHTSMTTLTHISMTVLLSNILPSDHNSDLPLPRC